MSQHEIRLYILTHKQTYIPNHPLLVPLQIGTALHQPLPGMLHDDTGLSISDKNNSYCELTGQYWAWKNEDAQYYGFYHYRRYFTFVPQKRPYQIYQFPDDAALQCMGYDERQMAALIWQYDLLLPMAEDMHETVWENYRRAPYHFLTDLQLVIQLLLERYPDYGPAAEQYLQGSRMYLKNMYIMKKELFDQYCSWLFPLLTEFDQCNDWSKYNNHPAALRVDGYLAERLFGIWYTHLRQTQSVRCCELGRIHFANLDGGRGNLQKMKLVNAVLPPGTKRRSLISRGARWALKQRANNRLLHS